MRLQLQKLPFSSSWLDVVPSEGLGLKLPTRTTRFLLRWWLGLPLRPLATYECPCCQLAMDPFGDHLVTCKLNHLSERHNALRNAVASVLRDHGFSTLVEQRLGSDDQRRPADIALMNLDPRGPLAVDLVVHHPGGMGTHRSGADALGTLKSREEDKHNASEAYCHSHGWLFSAMGWHTWGGAGPRANALLKKFDAAIAGDLRGWPKRQAIRAFRQKIVFRLMSFIGSQLLPAADAFPLASSTGGEWRDPVAILPSQVPLLTRDELLAWESEEEDEEEIYPPQSGRRRD